MAIQAFTVHIWVRAFLLPIYSRTASPEHTFRRRGVYNPFKRRSGKRGKTQQGDYMERTDANAESPLTIINDIPFQSTPPRGERTRFGAGQTRAGAETAGGGSYAGAARTEFKKIPPFARIRKKQGGNRKIHRRAGLSFGAPDRAARHPGLFMDSCGGGDRRRKLGRIPAQALLEDRARPADAMIKFKNSQNLKNPRHGKSPRRWCAGGFSGFIRIFSCDIRSRRWGLPHTLHPAARRRWARRPDCSRSR